MRRRRVRQLLGLSIALFGCGDDATPARDAGRDSAASPCSTDPDCDDGLYCSGVEACVPGNARADARGCVAPAGSVCLAGQTCSEELDRCVTTDCTRGADLDMDGVESVDCGGFDCDDADPTRAPGNDEFCDIAHHDEDCDPATFGVRDGDMDTYADASCCNEDAAGELVCGRDCDDTRAATNPGTSEVCNGLNDDCDAATDESVLRTYTIDSDGDGHGSADPGAMTMEACFTPADYAESADDCNDAERGINPGVPEICDEGDVDENCDTIVNPPALCDCTPPMTRDCMLPGLCAAGREMCVDGRWAMCTVAPAPEVCNEDDDDCDASTDEGLTVLCWADDDNDRYAASGAPTDDACPVMGRPEVGGCPPGFTNRAPFAMDIDCREMDGSIHPFAPEICNMIDDDCDSMLDEGVAIICYTDVDDDSYGVGGPRSLCPVLGRPEVGGCPVGFTNRPPALGADCNDMDPMISPAALEICDAAMVDENCDGMPNPPSDCMCVDMSTRPCPLPGVCATGNQTCVAGRWSSCSVSPSPEVCDSDDDDCDGRVDEGLVVDCYADGDDDTYAIATAMIEPQCRAAGRDAVGGCPFGFTNRAPGAGAIDCDDTDDLRHPGAPERCNRLDDDCVPASETNEDWDNDGHSPPAAACMDGFPKDDCADRAHNVFPGQTAYFGLPWCPDGLMVLVLEEPSRTSDPVNPGSFCCQVGFTCLPTSDPVPSWDYNCDMAVDRIGIASCTTPPMCSGGCGTSGFSYRPTNPPLCGELVSATECYCDTSGAPRCLARTDPTRPRFECH